MVFSSHLFLLVFLPLALAGFHALARAPFAPVWPRRLLILASMIFYGVWSWTYLGMLVATIAANFGLGRMILRQPTRERARWLLVSGVLGNLAVLAYFKYANFFLDNFNVLLGTQWSAGTIILPLAISFHTFQQIAFLVGVYRREDAETSFETYTLFVLFFPQLIAGPIVRHTEVASQLQRLGQGRDRALDLAVGSAIFVVGLAKKTLLADPLAAYANTAFSAAQAGAVDPATAWLGALAYALQLYFDFSAYSEMAVGLGRMFGVHLPINFWSPYQAGSITEFWRRWHMSLSRFLRDFLYIPLGGNRHGAIRTYLNLLVTMGLGGLWHGAAWNFVLWGLYHGVLLALHRLWRGLVPQHAAPRATATRTVAVLFTFLLITLGWVIFRAADLASAGRMFAAMSKLSVASLSALDKLALGHVGMLLLAVWFLPNTWQWIGRHHEIDGAPASRDQQRYWAWTLDWRWSVALAAVGAWAVLAAHRYTEFLYFQF